MLHQRKELSPAQQDQIIQMYIEGKSQQQIVSELDLGFVLVSRALHMAVREGKIDHIMHGTQRKKLKKLSKLWESIDSTGRST